MSKVVPVLETERLILRGISAEDTEAIVKWRSDPDVYLFFSDPHLLTEKEHSEWYEKHYLKDAGRLEWMCLRKDTGNKVGVFGIKMDKRQSEKAEISYLLSPQAQHCGFGREAVSGILSWCRINGMNEIYAVIHVKNSSSIDFIKGMKFYESAQDGNFMKYRKFI